MGLSGDTGVPLEIVVRLFLIFLSLYITGLYTGISDNTVQPEALSYFVALQLKTALDTELLEFGLCCLLYTSDAADD